MKLSLSEPAGFTLVELMLALALALVLLTGMIKIVGAASSSFRLQKNLATLQENGRFALATLGGEILPAGYQPDPWRPENTLPAISEASTEALTAETDQLGLRRWSQQNCLGNMNPQLDVSGQPAMFLRETDFVVNSGGNLAMSCRYGPGPGELTTQLNRLGLVEDVESFQVLYAEDSNQDGDADRWVSAGEWQAERNVLAVRLALLLRSPETAGAVPLPVLPVLDEMVTPPDDGHLRRVFSAVYSLKGRKQ